MPREIPLATPGEILNEEWLKPLGISQYALAKAIRVSPRRINQIVHGKRAITADTALRLAAFFGTDAQSWLNLQTHYDTEMERDILADMLAQIPRCLASPQSAHARGMMPIASQHSQLPVFRPEIRHCSHLTPPAELPASAVPQIGRACVGKECRSRWSPYH